MIVGRYNMHAEEIKLEKSKKVRNQKYFDQ